MELIASKCSRCEHVIIPPRDICPYCGPESPEQVQVSLEPRGEIVSFTALQRPPEGFDPPVVLALVQLDAGPTILSLGKKEELDQTRIGSRVMISRDASDRFVHSLT